MFSVVMMAALTTGMDLPDRGRRGGCCGGCYGGCGGCYGGGYGMGMGMGMGWGGCYGMGMGMGGYGMGRGGYGVGWGWGNTYPMMGGYAYSPLGAGNFLAPGMTQSLYYNPAASNQSNEATIVVHLPAGATLTFDGQPTQSRSDTRIFHSPPLEQGKTYVYTLRAEINRDGRLLTEEKTIEIKAGQRSDVRMTFDRRKEGNKERSDTEREP